MASTWKALPLAMMSTSPRMLFPQQHADMTHTQYQGRECSCHGASLTCQHDRLGWSHSPGSLISSSTSTTPLHILLQQLHSNPCAAHSMLPCARPIQGCPGTLNNNHSSSSRTSSYLQPHPPPAHAYTALSIRHTGRYDSTAASTTRCTQLPPPPQLRISPHTRHP
jgi:hypothetical protein